MELSVEETNFIKITKIVIEIIPKYLRRCFIHQWNQKYPKSKWKSDNASGMFLFAKLPDKIKNNKINEMSIERIKTGNEENWDTSTIALVMVNSGLKLIKGVRPSHERSTPLRISEGIDVIRSIRNLHFAHKPSMSCPSDDFKSIMMNMKSTARDIFDKDAEKEIDEIEKSQIETKMTAEQRRQLEIEINRSTEFDAVCGGNLKTKYKIWYGKHEIYAVDNRGSIVLKMKKIADFYMKLKICPDSPPEDTFTDEVLRHYECLKGLSDNDIDISQLVDEENDVTFVCGSAGLGKTVLAKKLAYGWANGEIYTEFPWCIMFKCRDILDFKAAKGVNLKNYELIEKFLETHFPFDFGDGLGMLFVIDGLDELSGRITGESMIGTLLELIFSKYSGSKFIITGRPHIEGTLSRSCGKMCELRKVEIQGLCDDQIEEYVKNFNSREGNVVDISNAKDSSNRYLPTMYVPQFLNTFCCVAKLLKQRPVCHAELYCWTLYLYLTQHGSGHFSNDKRMSDTFMEFSKDLVALCRICYKFVANDTVILEYDIGLELADTRDGKELIGSFFADASDNYRKKYQFKHLPLMGFLSALYICTCKARMRIIEDFLEKGQIEVVLLICQMIEGSWLGENSRESLLSAVNFKALGSRDLYNRVLELLQRCKLDDWIKFGQSLDIIGCFLNDAVSDEKSIISSVRGLRCGDSYMSNTKHSKKLYKIVENLKHVYGLEMDTISAAFDDIGAKMIAVNEYENLGCAKYLRNVDGVTLKEMKTSVSNIQNEIEAKVGEKCKIIVIENCQLDDENDEDGRVVNSNLEVLKLEKCKINESNFLQLCKWGTLCKVFIITALDVEDQWWPKLVETIEHAKKNRSLKLKTLYIRKFTTMLSSKLLKRINQCEVDARVKVLKDSETRAAHSSEENSAKARRVTFPQSATKARPLRRSEPSSGISESIRSGFSAFKRRFTSISNLANPHTSGNLIINIQARELANTSSRHEMTPKPRRKLSSILSKANPHSSISSSLRSLSISTPNLTCSQESPVNDDCKYQDIVSAIEENDNIKERQNAYSDEIYSKVSEELQSFPWFFGTMSANEAKSKLQYHRNGTFLVRESVAQKGEFVISLIYEKETKHVTIEARGGVFNISDLFQFRSIPKLIEFYMKHSLSYSYPTLPTTLVRWIPTQDVVVVQFPYAAKNEKELSLRTGARISVINRDGNWWYGELDGKLGYFPKNYVEDAFSKS